MSKTDKRNFVEGLAQEAEKAAASSLRNQNGQSDKNGSVLMGADKQHRRINQTSNQLRQISQIDCNKYTRETAYYRECGHCKAYFVYILYISDDNEE